jgi:hypothetical protein
MRPQKDIALLIVFLIAGVLTQVYNCRLMQGEVVGVGKVVITSGHPGTLPIHQSRGSGNISLRIPLQEEDDDDSAKEMLHSTSVFHSIFLDQLYARQHLIFTQLFLDISTPPPRRAC